MKDLQFSRREGDFLILEDEHGQTVRLEINTELRQAMRNQTTQPSSFSPGEIQSLIRSGKTLEEVCEQLGVDSDQVEPFAAPVLAELDYVRSSALAVYVVAQDFDETVELSKLLTHRMGDVHYRVSKQEDRWLLSASTGDNEAVFSFDPRNNWLKPVNDTAREIFDEQSAPVSLSVIDNSDPEPEEPTTDASSVATDLLEELQRRRAQKESEPYEPKPESSSKRPSLPSWDEIVFGAGDGKKDEEED